ncbi:MAG: entericidin A/B family lipoprotein [Candidatus Hydrogenedentes bacterium]|nr:entericidin A/B family lipoprotein [Candidatus Hydrogenedentota bacterium]
MKILLGTTAVLLILVATGCNTVKGIGKDLQRGGRAVEKAAE